MIALSFNLKKRTVLVQLSKYKVVKRLFGLNSEY